MAVPSVIFFAGCLLVAVPVRRSSDQAAVSTASLGLATVPVPGRDRPGTEIRPAGRSLGEVTDPFALEVHRPVQPEDPSAALPTLPAYVPREHDAELGLVVRAAAKGSSRIAVLVGGSSTGKTRACWEALALLRDRPEAWRLWHPIDPSRPDAALRELPVIGPRTVVWLNEAQFYLDVTDGGLGERVAARLRELLRDPARAPVLVLATLWPQFWDALTVRPDGGADPHAQARELLAGHDIAVPAAFTPAQLQRLGEAGDARLAQAAAGARDGQVIQFLAGAPELLARYRNAPPAAAALIHAAMDARRLGMGAGLPQSFLEAAAPGYLSGAEWDALSGDWREQALAYVAVPCKGVRGPLTLIHPHPARAHTTGSGDSDEPLFRLADYLDQHGRHHRKDRIPPAGFWAAAAAHASPADQAALGDAAHNRGLYRDAAQLHKNAAARGNLDAALYLARPPGYFRADVRPLRSAAAHAPLDSPGGVAALLGSLRKAGAQDQAAALLARDPAAHARLDNPYRVATLLDSLRKAGAQDQAAALADRAAAHAPLDNPDGVATLLDSLRKAGAQDQAAALLARDPAAHARLDNPYRVAALLGSLRKAGAQDQAAALLARDPAAHARLDNPYGVTALLDSLRKAGAQDQAAALADRAAAHAPLDNPRGVARLLGSLRVLGAQDQAAALAGRAAAHAPLDSPDGVAALLGSLREAGAQDQAAALLARDPAAHARLDDPDGVAALLGSLREAGAQDQAAALADRAAAHAPLDNPYCVAALLGSLRKAGAQDQAAALLARDPAAHARLDDPYGVAALLGSLRKAGAQDQAAALLARDPAAHAPLDWPAGVARLLDSLREAGAQDQAAALATRLPGAGMFGLFREQESPQDRFRFGREADGSPARPWGWEDLD
jgi:hypothetical protein